MWRHAEGVLFAQAIQSRGLGARVGNQDAAERLCLDVLELAPDRPRALGVLYEIRKRKGNTQAALALARRLVALDPNNFAGTNALTLLLLGAGALAQAERHARNAVRIANWTTLAVAKPRDTSDTEPRFVAMSGVKPREATAEGGLDLTPDMATQAESVIGGDNLLGSNI